MSTRVFHPESSATQSLPAFELQFVPLRQSVIEFPRSRRKEEVSDEPSSQDPGCARGVRSALAIEAAAALMVYGLWQLSHLIR